MERPSYQASTWLPANLWSSGQSVIKIWSRIKTWHFCLHDELLLCHFVKFHPSCQCYFNSSSPAQTYVSIIYLLITLCIVCILPLLAGFATEKKEIRINFDPFQWILSHWTKFQTLNKRRLTTCCKCMCLFWISSLEASSMCPFYSTFGGTTGMSKNTVDGRNPAPPGMVKAL